MARFSRIRSTVSLAVVVGIGYSSAAFAQVDLYYPDNQVITNNSVVGLKLTNQGSKGALELLGNAYAQDPVLKVRSQTNGIAAYFDAIHEGDRPGVQVASYCSYGSCYALQSETNIGTGVYGLGSVAGVKGTGNSYGLWGVNRLTNGGVGVLATNTTTNGYGSGLYATSDHGIAGNFRTWDWNNNGYGYDAVKAESTIGNGVWGLSDSTGASGVYGYNGTGGGYGVAGRTVNGGIAVYGDTGHISNGYSGFFTGKAAVIGTLSKGAGSFKIDHPLDPANKFLYHSFVESPDMMNVYNGIATLDATGTAMVQMPDWFSALNRDFRYQLTSIGKFSPVFVSTEMSANNQFGISGGVAGQRISWQVTGIRQDKFANQNRIPVEEAKGPTEVGKYLHPTAFGLAQTMSIYSGPKQSQ